jgi:hypothetical protein
VHVEDTVRPRDDLDDADDVLPLLEDARHQTGSVGSRPSGDAVLDPNVALDHRFNSTTRRPPSVAAPGRGAPKGGRASPSRTRAPPSRHVGSTSVRAAGVRRLRRASRAEPRRLGHGVLQ